MMRRTVIRRGLVFTAAALMFGFGIQAKPVFAGLRPDNPPTGVEPNPPEVDPPVNPPVNPPVDRPVDPPVQPPGGDPPPENPPPGDPPPTVNQTPEPCTLVMGLTAVGLVGLRRLRKK